jgi:hypothetical protein
MMRGRLAKKIYKQKFADCPVKDISSQPKFSRFIIRAWAKSGFKWAKSYKNRNANEK